MALFSKINLGRYAPGDSAVHSMDPRAKLVVCVLALGGSMWRGSPWSVAATWPLMACALWASEIDLGYFIKGLKPLAWVFGVAVLLHGLTTPGTYLWPTPLFGVAISLDGLLIGLTTAAQLATAAAFASLLTLTTAPRALSWGMEKLTSPLKRVGVPVEEFFWSVVMALGFFPMLGKELDRILLERRELGLKERPGWREVVKTLILRVLDRADRMADEVDRSKFSSVFSSGDWVAVGLGSLTLFIVLS